ncbi:hypothetical protein [Marilutibacter spongiae]|uniref:DUF2589 domain-containing protein n=1 Tax=Marilutibacter spongiae TaxID=2025720 RepID=A0A7W3TL74_9GAMM|nr:hypothetical protein [Lysobacter spongiae]MBB1060385.1 hypothetical protein [Lysobacter spongiae]
MLTLDKHDATFVNLNTRIERHGDERELAADIKLSLRAQNTILDQLEPGLRKDIFRKPSRGEQPDIPEIGGDQLVAVKHPSIEPLRLSHEFEGYEIEIAGLMDHVEPLLLVDVKLKKFVVAPLEGGSVELTFTASTNVGQDEVSELCEAFVREDVRLTVTPPKRQAQGDPEDSREAA